MNKDKNKNEQKSEICRNRSKSMSDKPQTEYQKSTSNESESIPVISYTNSASKEITFEIHKERETKGQIYKERFRKCLRLSSEKLTQLKLKDGLNEVVFSVTTAYQGTSRCKCHLFLWNYDVKIIISDVDGTITKSDVLGHVLPIIGRDWAQGGVTRLFSKIGNNGYRFLYLSARAIGQSHVTREYLRSIRQDDIALPDGPLLLNPTSLMNALHREVIERKPEEFKIPCLKDILSLFPEGSNPFYAGFGNKINDVWTYRAINIPISKIFTINHKGELRHELTKTFLSSYYDLTTIVDHMFPPLHGNFQGATEFSAFLYWHVPIIDFTIN